MPNRFFLKVVILMVLCPLLDARPQNSGSPEAREQYRNRNYFIRGPQGEIVRWAQMTEAQRRNYLRAVTHAWELGESADSREERYRGRRYVYRDQDNRVYYWNGDMLDLNTGRWSRMSDDLLQEYRRKLMDAVNASHAARNPEAGAGR